MKNKNMTLGPTEIAGQFEHSVHHKNAIPTARLWVYSILGGAFISLGGLLAIIVAGGLPELSTTNPGLIRFSLGAVFPIGLVLVLIGGAELFTSSCAVASFGLLNRNISLLRLARIWCIGYLGNFAGALLIGYLFAYESGILNAEPWLSFSMQIGEAKTSSSFLKVFIKGIGANWLVCMAVWMSYAAREVTGKILLLWIPVMAFVALGFEHSIANMFFIPTAMLLGAEVGMADFLLRNLLPATLGNIVGGAVMVALPYWFMFSSDKNFTAGSDQKPVNPEFDLNGLPNLNKHLN